MSLKYFSLLILFGLVRADNATSPSSGIRRQTVDVCDDETCEFDCREKYSCRYRTLVCTNKVKNCLINCGAKDACKDYTKVYSFAQNTKIECISKDSCMTANLNCGQNNGDNFEIPNNRSSDEFVLNNNPNKQCIVNCGSYGCKDSIFQCSGNINHCILYANFEETYHNFENGQMNCNLSENHSQCTLFCGTGNNYACSQTTKIACQGNGTCHCVGAYQHRNKITCYTIPKPTPKPSTIITKLKKTSTATISTLLNQKKTPKLNTLLVTKSSRNIHSSLKQTTGIIELRKSTKIVKNTTNTQKITNQTQKQPELFGSTLDPANNKIHFIANNSKSLPSKNSKNIFLVMGLILTFICCFGLFLCFILCKRTRKLEKELVSTHSNSTFANSVANPNIPNNKEPVHEGVRSTSNFTLEKIETINNDDVILQGMNINQFLKRKNGAKNEELSALTENKFLCDDDEDTSGSATSGSEKDDEKEISFTSKSLVKTAHRKNSNHSNHSNHSNSNYSNETKETKESKESNESNQTKISNDSQISDTQSSGSQNSSTQYTQYTQNNNNKIELNYINGDKKIINSPNVGNIKSVTNIQPIISKNGNNPTNYQQMMMDQIKTNLAILNHVNEINKTDQTKIPIGSQATILAHLPKKNNKLQENKESIDRDKVTITVSAGSRSVSSDSK